MARDLVGPLFRQKGENISLLTQAESIVNMKYQSLPSGESASAPGPNESIAGLWINDTEVTAGIFYSTEGLPLHRITLEFFRPLDEYLEVLVGVQRNDGEEYDWSVAEPLLLYKGATYGLIHLKEAEGAKRLCLAFRGDGYVPIPIGDIVLDGNDRHILDGVRALPWVFIILVSLSGAYFLTLIILNGVRRHYLSFMLAGVFLMSLIVYRDFICEKIPYLYSSWDGFSQYLPTYQSYINSLKDYGYLPRWTFSIGFGSMQSYEALLYPLNAISLLCGVISGTDALETSYIWMQIAKIELAALFMYLFLRELNMKRFVCVCAGMAYAFCGIMILRGNWVFLGDEVYLSAMLLWAVERYFRRSEWMWIPPVIYLVATCLSIYYVYLYALLLIVYATARYIFERGTMRGFLKYILRCGLLFLLGVVMYGVILLGVTGTYFQTARYDNTVSRFSLSVIFERATWDVLLTAVMRLFSTDILGVYDLYTGYANYLEGPLFYCGILCLFMLPQALKAANGRQRGLIIFGLVAAVIYMVFPFVTDVTCAFIHNAESGLRSYRLSSEWICVMLTVIAAFGLDRGLEEKRFSLGAVIVAAAGLFALFLFSAKAIANFEITVDHDVEIKVIAFMIVWLLVLLLFKNTKPWRALMLATIMVEALIFSDVMVSRSYYVAFSTYTQMQKDTLGYYSSVPKVVKALKAEDDGLYRIGGVRPYTGGSRHCSPLYFDLFDSAYYTSIDNCNYSVLNALYPESFDMMGVGSKMSIGVSNNPTLSTLTGYKYYLCLANREDLHAPEGYEKLKTIDNIDIYVNPQAYSFGTTFEYCISTERFMALPIQKRQDVALECLVLDDPSAFGLREVSDVILEHDRMPKGRHEALEVAEWKPDRIEGRVQVEEDCLMLFTIPNIKGWKVTVDGAEAELVPMDLGFFGIRLTPGAHDVKLAFEVASFRMGLYISLAGIAAYLLLLICARRASWLEPFAEGEEKQPRRRKNRKKKTARARA